MTQAKVKEEDFVVGVLANHNAKQRKLAGSLCEVELPQDLAAALGFRTAGRIVLTFDSKTARVVPGTELIAPGSPLLRKLLDLASTRGFVANMVVRPGLISEVVGLWSGLEKTDLAQVLQQLTAGGGQPAPAARKLPRSGVSRLGLVFRRQVLMRFKITYKSDEPVEALEDIVMDPLTEEAAPPSDLCLAADWRRPSFATGRVLGHSEHPGRSVCPGHGAHSGHSSHPGGEPSQALDYALERLYMKARQVVLERAHAFAERLESANSARRQRETRRLDDYYSAMAGEALEPLRKALRSAAFATVTSQLARTREAASHFAARYGEAREKAGSIEKAVSQKLKEIELERQVRLNEMEARYKVSAAVALCGAANIYVPHLVAEFQTGRSGAAVGRERAGHRLVFDLSRSRLVEAGRTEAREVIEGPRRIKG